MKTAAALDEGLKYVIHINNPRQISRSEDGKLIHVTGILQTDQVSKTIENIRKTWREKHNEKSVRSVFLPRTIYYLWIKTQIKQTIFIWR